MPRVVVGGWNIGSVKRPEQPSGTKAARFEVAERTKTNIKEASDVVALPGGRFLVVGDTSDKVGLMEADGSVSKLKLPHLPNGKPSQMEGVAYDPVKHNLFVSREENREVVRYDWDPDKKKDPKYEKTIDLKHMGGPDNKGVEGLTYLPGEFSPTGSAQLLAAKEGSPRELVLLDKGGGGKPQKIKLEDQVKSVCKDFSAVAVDPKTGNIFLSSDESSTVAQVELKRDGDKLVGRLVQSFPLRDNKDKPLARIEGLTFNEKGDLFVLTENDGVLMRLARKN
jgi:uncharacterized protein YjiK